MKPHRLGPIATDMNGATAGVGVGLSLATAAHVFGFADLLFVPGELLCSALAPALTLLWYTFWALLLGAGAVYCFLLESLVVSSINAKYYTVDADGKPTGVLAAALTAENIEIQLIRCRLAIRHVQLNPTLLDDALFDPYLNWTPFRTRKIQVAKLRLKWSLLRAPRVHVKLDGLHISSKCTKQALLLGISSFFNTDCCDLESILRDCSWLSVRPVGGRRLPRALVPRGAAGSLGMDR